MELQTPIRYLLDTNVWLAACTNNPLADGQDNSPFDRSEQQAFYHLANRTRTAAPIAFVRSQILTCLKNGPVVVPAETIVEIEKVMRQKAGELSPFNQQALNTLIGSLKTARQPRMYFTPTEMAEQSALLTDIAIAGANPNAQRPYLQKLASNLPDSVLSIPTRNRERLRPLTDDEKLTTEAADRHRHELGVLTLRAQGGKLGKDWQRYDQLLQLERADTCIRQAHQPLYWEDWVLFKAAQNRGATVVTLDNHLIYLSDFYNAELHITVPVSKLEQMPHSAEHTPWNRFLQQIKAAAQPQPGGHPKELHPNATNHPSLQPTR